MFRIAKKNGCSNNLAATKAATIKTTVIAEKRQ